MDDRCHIVLLHLDDLVLIMAAITHGTRVVSFLACGIINIRKQRNFNQCAATVMFGHGDPNG